MKIEIDLNDILGDEDGVETLQESVRRQVIDTLTRQIKDGVGKRIHEATVEMINNELQVQLRERMPAIIEDVIHGEYIPVSTYGSRGTPTTFRAELLKAIHAQMVYKKATYESDKTAFTKAVDAVVSSQMTAYQAEFNKLVKDTFTKDALAYAVTELRKRLGLT